MSIWCHPCLLESSPNLNFCQNRSQLATLLLNVFLPWFFFFFLNHQLDRQEVAVHCTLISFGLITNYGKLLHLYIGHFYFFLEVPANLPIQGVLTSRAAVPLLSKTQFPLLEQTRVRPDSFSFSSTSPP